MICWNVKNEIARGNIIDFLTDSSNEDYINTNIKKYLNMSIDNYIQDLSTKDNLIYNGIIELLILSKLYRPLLIGK